MDIDTIFPGNCKFCVIYNLGKAEDIEQAEDFYHFLYLLREVYSGNYESVILCTTNDEQFQERAWLEQAEFQTHHIEDCDLQMHTILRPNLRKVFRENRVHIDKYKKQINRKVR